MQQQQRHRSRELFPTDQPIAAERMIGRSEDVGALARLLANGIHQIVAGPRRTGKTTVCSAALERLRADGNYVVELDLFRIGDDAELAEILVAETIANRSAVQRGLAKAKRAGVALRDGAALQTVMRMSGELGEEIEIAYRPGFAGRDPERYLDYAIALPERVAAADGRQLILFIDEFQEIASGGDPYGDPDGLTKRMRAILQRSEHVTCLFAGSLEHLMRDLFVPTHRALHAFGGFYELTEIEAEAWRQGLTERFGEDGCELTHEAAERLIELGERRPRVTMLLAQHTHNASLAAAERRIDAGLVAVGLAEAMAAEKPTHELTIARIRDWRKMGRDALAVAGRIARGETTYGELEPKRARRAIDGLRDAAIIEQPREREWRVGDPLLRRYLAER